MATLHLLLALVAALPVQAQSEGGHTHLVVGGGASFAGGSATTNAGPGLAAHVGLRHQREILVFSVRAGTNYGGTAPINLPGSLRDRFDELALMAGYAAYRSENSQVVLSAGVASVSGERVATHTDLSGGASNVRFSRRLGVPLQIALSAPGGGSGFGFVVHANVNPEETFGAITVTYLLDLGR